MESLTDTQEWHIPAERMKMRKAHIVPLSSQAMQILKELYALQVTNHLFPSRIDEKAHPSRYPFTSFALPWLQQR